MEYEWIGDTKACKMGVVPNYIQQKVEDRINYFRVSAGVPPIYLDSQLNDWCQRAALVMESNNKLNHEISKIWSCYSAEAAEAAKYGLLTQNATTTLAVTSFVADQTHPTLGNRRWMLYPLAWFGAMEAPNPNASYGLLMTPELVIRYITLAIL